MGSKIGFEMSLIIVEAIRGRCASFISLPATVSEIFGGQTTPSILVVKMYVESKSQVTVPDLRVCACVRDITHIHQCYSLMCDKRSSHKSIVLHATHALLLLACAITHYSYVQSIVLEPCSRLIVQNNEAITPITHALFSFHECLTDAESWYVLCRVADDSFARRIKFRSACFLW